MPSNDPALTWEQRLVAALPLPPVVTALGLAAVAFSSYLAFALTLGLDIVSRDGELRLPIEGGAWTAIVLSLLAGYTLLVAHHAIERSAEDLVALEPLAKRRRRLRRSWTDSMSRASRSRRTVAASGCVIGAALWTLTAYRLAQSLPLGALLRESGWFMVATPLLGWQTARAAFFTVLGLRVIDREADAGLDVDLFDPDSLAPFVRMGLRNALTWIVGSTIVSLLFVNIPVEDIFAVLPVLLAIVGLAIAVFAVPIRRARLEIRRAKRAEIAGLDAEIRADREELRVRGRGSAAAAARLPGLIAYRTLVESVREWPLDTRTLSRFLLYSMIPLGGWIGGALVERLVDAWLG